MKDAFLIAASFGLCLGLVFSYHFSKWLIRLVDIKSCQVSGRILAILSVVPALYLGIADGSNIGGAYGKTIMKPLGLDKVGVPLGIGFGITLTTVLVICGAALFGIALGILIDELFIRY